MTWFREGFHAKISAPLAKEKESPESVVDSGLSLQGSFARYDPHTHGLKTAQCSLFEDYQSFLLTLPHWGLMQNGALYLQKIPVLPTRENESGFWATPTTMDKLPPKSEEALMHEATTARPGRSKPANLRDQVSNMPNWPNPTASQGRSQGMINQMRKLVDQGILGLLEAEQMIVSLESHVKMFPTPCHRDGKGTSKNRTKDHPRHNRNLDSVVELETGEIIGRLNPMWVEKLMGWPDQWTSLKPISHVNICFWLMGFCDEENRRSDEVLRVLRQGYASQEVQRAIGRPVGIQEAAVLLADMCEYQDRPDEARVFMACSKALESEMRGVWISEGTTGSPHRPRQVEQRSGEHTDAMQALSRLLAHHGAKAWKSGSWEDGVPRVADGVAFRVDMLKAIGNGQVPLCAATAWRLLANI